MPLSTAKRESLIPRLHLLSILLLLLIAFVALLPSRDTFKYSASNTPGDKAIDLLDLAYLKARDASGDLSEKEMLSVIHDMIRSKKWVQARTLMAQRPDIKLEPRDQFLLDLETASAGFYGAENEARSASYKANLIGIMDDLYVTPVLHDEDTLTRAAEFSADLGQPGLSSRYYKLMADKFPEKASENYDQCGRVLQRFGLYGESVDCFETAISLADNPIQRNEIQLRLGRLHHNQDKRLAANSTLEKMVRDVPRDLRSLQRTAAFALENERPDLAYPLYARLADVEGGKAVYWLEKASLWAEASNQPGLAAEYVLSIRDLSDQEFRAQLNRRRQSLLIAAGRNEEAMATMFERIAANPESGEELIEGIQLASGFGMTQQAMEWNEALLRIRPFDIEAMSRQIDYALASQRLEEALVWNKKILEQEPKNQQYNVRLAQLEEWNGNVDAAMKQRVWLAANFPSAANDRELLRLAELNWDSQTAAETLHRIARATPLTTEEIMKLVKLYEQDGTPWLAASALEEMLDGTKDDAMLLRELASLHTRHVKYEEALAAWEQFADRFGRSAEESLNRMELLWRLKRPEEAVAVTDQINQFNSNGANQYQLALLTELGWRYRKPELVYAAAPYLDQLDKDRFGSTSGRRIVQSLIDNNDYEQAIQTAENLWRETDDISFLLSAIHIALKENIYPHYERYLDADGDLIKVRDIPEYWLTIADYHNKKADSQAAIETYRNTLAMQPKNTDAIAGLIWTMLGNNIDDTTLLETLDEFQTAATELPALWNPYAVGYLRAGEAEKSLRWFSKLMAKDDHDYNILLSFADALEQTGNNTHSYKVRQYAMQKLLPQVMASANNKIDDLGRDYISILRSYGSAAENEAWTQKLLDGIEDTSPEEGAWRRELAASWYLATQRNDYARLVMTKMHERRLESPVWQRLAVALGENNLPVVKEILASSKGELTTGDEILALRKLGLERKAYVLAKNTLAHGKTANDRDVAREHMMSIRGSRPGYYSGLVTQRELGRLNITESGLSLRHTMSAADLGFEVDYRRNTLSSDILNVANTNEDNVTVSAHFGNSTRGGRLTAGVNSNGADDLNYTSGEYYVRDRTGRTELLSEVAFNEISESGDDFRLGAKQDMAALTFQTPIGEREFVKVSGNVNELATRTTDQRIARGVSASIEVGATGSVGSNNWTMGVVASGEKNDREALSTQTSFNLSDESQQLALSASWFRGGIRADYPSAASPRYRVSARLGHSWPAESTALRLEAGAGFRVMGNDELSLQLEHNSQVQEVFDGNQSLSTFGIQYTNHF